jgi:hypothetical protein
MQEGRLILMLPLLLLLLLLHVYCTCVLKVRPHESITEPLRFHSIRLLHVWYFNFLSKEIVLLNSLHITSELSARQGLQLHQVDVVAVDQILWPRILSSCTLGS